MSWYTTIEPVYNARTYGICHPNARLYKSLPKTLGQAFDVSGRFRGKKFKRNPMLDGIIYRIFGAALFVF